MCSYLKAVNLSIFFQKNNYLYIKISIFYKNKLINKIMILNFNLMYRKSTLLILIEIIPNKQH